jgi:peptidyl-prolyl cis-trans isomerase SurA
MLPKGQDLNHTHRFLGVLCLAALVGATPALGQLAGTHAAPPPTATPAGPPTQSAAPPSPPPGAAVQSDTGPADGVAAIVNDAIITEYDLRQRILLFVSTSGLQPTPEILAKLRGQVLSQLETEQLQIQEARKKGITVSPTDVDKSIERITTDNHLTKDQLTELLKKGGVDMSTLRAQIAVQIAWQKAVEDEFQDRVNITPADIDAELTRLQEGANKPHYLVSEIFLAVDNPEVDAKVLKDAQDIETQLQSGATFGTVARQFSQSPTAASGGDMGWVHQGQLPAEIDDALQHIQVGSVSPPIRSSGGYYIIGLRDRQEGLGTKLPDPATQKSVGPLTVDRVLLPLGPTPAAQLKENAIKIAIQIHDHVNGCDTLPKIQQQIRGLVVQDLSKMGIKITDLSPEIQGAIEKAGPGEATPPFTSPAGIEMMVRCDKRAPTITAYTIPSRQQIEEQLFDQQITMLSRRYIRDLRRAANVETR